MMRRSILASTTAVVSLLSLAGMAVAQTNATAMTDLNIRSGPGPNYEVVGLIGADVEATVHGCIEGSKWCKVTHDGVEGWAYADYLTAAYEGAAEPVVLSEWPVPERPVVTYEITTTDATGTTTTTGNTGTTDTVTTTTGTTTTVAAENEVRDGEGGAIAGAASGALAGALIGGPVGAAIGGVAGAAIGGATEDAIDPPPEVVTYVRENAVEPVYLEGEVVVGAGLPENVEIREIPDTDYRYVYVNRQPVLVNPENRRIVYVVR